MAALDRLRRRSADDETVGGGGGGNGPAPISGSSGLPAEPDRVEPDRTEEDALRARLSEDPNDFAAFDRLAEIVRTRATEGHDVGDPQREADDAVWALAEEVAQSSRAWYPLIELARLSIDDDRDVALRRIETGVDRDPTGEALARGLAMLRESGHPVDALNLGVGHWRPREHAVEAGRQLIESAIEAGRPGEARRQLEALAAHPDQAGVEKLRRELEDRVTLADQEVAQRRTGSIPIITDPPPPLPPPPAAPDSAAPDSAGSAAPAVDVREDKEKGGGLLGFLRR
jgi:hypothetical protein